MPSEQNVNEQAEVIKLGLDIHANKYVVARQIDGREEGRGDGVRVSKYA